MAEYLFGCPQCGQQLLVDGTGLGQVMECPKCHKGIVVPKNLPEYRAQTAPETPQKREQPATGKNDERTPESAPVPKMPSADSEKKNESPSFKSSLDATARLVAYRNGDLNLQMELRFVTCIFRILTISLLISLIVCIFAIGITEGGRGFPELGCTIAALLINFICFAFLRIIFEGVRHIREIRDELIQGNTVAGYVLPELLKRSHENA